MALSASGVCKVIGNGGELRDVAGTPVLGFRGVFSNGKDKSGEWRPGTFVNCSIWGQRAAKLAEYVTEGKSYMVRGVVTVREYEHQGEKRYALEMRLDDLEFLPREGGQQQSQGSRGGGNVTSAGRSAAGGYGNAGGEHGGIGDDGDLPF